MGQEFPVRSDGRSDAGVPKDAMLWQQSFSVLDRPALWVVAGKDVWSAAGRLTLEAAGINSATDDDWRSTWREILAQSMSGLANGFSGDLESADTASQGSEILIAPADLVWTVFTVNLADGTAWHVRLAWSKDLAALYDGAEPMQKALVSRDTAVSRTFDLLLDVALPVSVSFGKTSLQVREVLKLNSGSIIELDRFVAEPVDVIVNNCVIARGEVVVVEGNYGVRITQLASREDRLRSGIPESNPRMAGASR